MTAEANGLLSQYKLLGAVINAKWSKGLDLKVTYHVIQRYYRQFANSRISVSYLEKATGASRTRIVAALRKLARNGVFSVARKGAGTRPTEYALNFDFASKVSSIGENVTTTSSAETDNTSSVEFDTTNSPSGVQLDTQSYLQDRLTSRSTEGRTEEATAAASPPPSCGLAPATPVAAVDPEKSKDPFQALWEVWARKDKRADARDAYKALAPDGELHERLVESAMAWTTSYLSNSTERRFQKYLHTWIKGECWLEDLPLPYESYKEAAISRAKKRGPKEPVDTASIGANGLTAKTPLGRHEVEIIGSDLVAGGSFDGAESPLTFNFRITEGNHEGREFAHKFFLVSPDQGIQEQGQRFFSDIRRATNIGEPEDTKDFHGARLLAIVKHGGKIEYEPI